MFITEFLNLKEPPEVIFYKDLKFYKIVGTEETKKSVLNTITYGVRSDGAVYGAKQYLTALDIIEQTLNAKTIKVFDYVPKKKQYIWSIVEYDAIFNRTKTIEAQNKQKAVTDAFRNYVYSQKARIERFEGYYNDNMVGYTYSAYNGDFLKLADLNDEITLYKHQRDAIARVLLSGGNVLFSHDVGTGKTYEMIVSVHELHRMGISKKNLVVVPNNVLGATVDAHRTLYGNDKILAIYPKDFTPAKRRDVLEAVKTNDYTAVYMAYSSFDMLVMSKKYYIDKYSRELGKIKASIYNAKSKYEKNALKRQEKLISKRLSDYVAKTKECAWQTFDSLGIETLVVDEAHNYKNIPIPTRADGVVGIGGTSKKCREMLEKAHFVKRLIFATGTPLTNSLADLFTFQLYLQPRLLAYHNINTFDTWVNTFGQRETTVECDVDANSTSLRTMTRFSSFHNLGELMSLFSQVCDFHHMPKDADELPLFNGHTDVCVPKNEIQHRYIQSLSERTEKIRNKEVSRNEDNLLKVTTDGRLAALDIRLVDAEGCCLGGEDNKISVCAGRVAQLLEEHPDSVQIVFSDIGTPKEGFNVYDELLRCLVKCGVNKSKIAYVHDAASDSVRAKLFEAMNKGGLNVVIGSTQKLGVGVNVQERLVAIHHLSVPWRPADMVQREGRILRKGNTCEEVFIYRYITEGSFDAYSWQLLENKQRFISSFLGGTSAARDMDDIADTVLTYAEVKALAIGNPLIKKRVEVANRLERAKIACRSRQREMQQLCAVIQSLPEKIKSFERLAKTARNDYAFYLKNKKKVSNTERIAFGEELLEALAQNGLMPVQRLFDTYQGFEIYLPENMNLQHRYVLVKSKYGGLYRCEMNEERTVLGCSKSIDYLLEHLDERESSMRKNAESARIQMRQAQADLEKDNPYLEEIKNISEALSKIDEILECVA